MIVRWQRRKLDAVYLYMRSLMASNPFQSARESLVSLFDENRKKVNKPTPPPTLQFLLINNLFFFNCFVFCRFSHEQYEQQERKRREAKEASSNRRREAAAAATSDAARIDSRGLRREIWIHPLDGRRTRRTTSTSGSNESANVLNSDDEELAQLPSIEVRNKGLHIEPKINETNQYYSSQRQADRIISFLAKPFRDSTGGYVWVQGLPFKAAKSGLFE